MSISNNTLNHLNSLSQKEINEHYTTLAQQNNLLPIKVTPFYSRKVMEEVSVLRNTSGPLHRVAYPTIERLIIRAPNEVPDFVDDRKNMEATHEFIIRKYKERFLFLPTSRCLGHCQYCFRQDVLEEQKTKQPTGIREQINAVIAYINQHPELIEIILTGGDPMILPFNTLQEIFISLREKTKIESIRIHTRALIYAPHSLTDQKIKLLADTNVRFITHSVHPYEICDEVIFYINKLKRSGIRLYNQFPLLRNTNDHPEVLIKHIKKLEELDMRTLTVFIPDPINYSAPYRVNLKRLRQIINKFKWSTPSWINSTRFVLDTHYGKVRMEDLVSYDNDTKIAIFKREDKEIEYPDFPEELDIPGDLQTMLWKG